MESCHGFAAGAPHPDLSSQRRVLPYSEATIAQKYAIAHRVRLKLGKEAAREDHRLRYLVCHANTLDWLIGDLAAAQYEPSDGLVAGSGNNPAKVTHQSPNYHSLSTRHNEASQVDPHYPVSAELAEGALADGLEGDKSPEETDSDSSSCASDDFGSEDDNEDVFRDWNVKSNEQIEGLVSVMATAEADEEELGARCRSPELEKADLSLDFNKFNDGGIGRKAAATVSFVALSP